jgi:hypothetical protein
MTICRACSCEIPGPDRFCRNCGAPVAPAVAEWDDTRRFNPSAPLPAGAPGLPDTTNPLYAPPSATYAAPVSAPLHDTKSLVKRLLKGKGRLTLVMLVILIVFAAGIGIGSNAGRRRGADRGDEAAAEQNEENAEMVRRQYEEAVQNALGFKQGTFSAAEFRDTQGIFVNSLMSDDSPAALAKIQAGDLLTELNNQPVRNDSELSQVLNSLTTGEDVPAKVYRDGAMVSTRIKIGDRHFPPLQPKIEPRDQGFLGIRNSARRCCLPGTKKWGVEITELHVNGPAELFGLRTGDVITDFNGDPVKTPNEFNRRIRAIKPNSKIPITFYRGNTPQKIEIILGRRW